MLADLNNFLMTVTIMTGIFLVTRYVFLEHGMEAKKQKIYYIISYGVILLAFFFMGKDVAQIVAMLMGGLNISLGRKKYRILGFYLVVPLAGLINGIAAAMTSVMLMEVFLPDAPLDWVTLFLYFLVAVFLLVFYFKGKNWRRWFAENMQNRRLRVSEYIVVWLSGVLMYAGSATTALAQECLMGNSELLEKLGIADAGALVLQNEKKSYLYMLLGYEVLAFLLTLTIIVLVMQGNQRKFDHDRISSMQFHMITTMADIVENRDANTGGHIRRTAKYVEIIGKNLRKKNKFAEILTDQYLADMVVAAPLHDIGKISIPDAILNKPGRLTDEEFEIMKTHAAAGREVLNKAAGQLGEFNYLNIAQDMAEYHHEWWNGKGYPNGIGGEEIPLCARIMAVADVFDALTSKRCYKDAMPLDKAYGIIREETGTHFDPVIGETFLNASKEIEEAMKELADSDMAEGQSPAAEAMA